MTAWDRVEKLLGKDNLTRLGGSKVAVIGLGSGGGFVAQTLAMCGVGHFVLIDDDTVDSVNVVRHVADKRYLGQTKVDAVADLIRQRNDKAQIQTIVGRVEQHTAALEGVDMVVVGVDGENAKYIINEVCLKHNLKAVYAGVYERGEGGDVCVIRPYNGPCYACWAQTLRDNMVTTTPTGALDYGMIGPEGTIEAEPALWLHVVRVAAVQSDLVLNELLDGTDHYKPMPANTIVMANNAIEILEGQVTPPHSSLWLPIERDPNCLVCGDAVRARRNLMAEGEEITISLDDLGIQQQDQQSDGQ
jgi:molybdopterin/thiamine biosynthesis adenylyltransferase